MTYTYYRITFHNGNVAIDKLGMMDEAATPPALQKPEKRLSSFVALTRDALQTESIKKTLQETGGPIVCQVDEEGKVEAWLEQNTGSRPQP